MPPKKFYRDSDSDDSDSSDNSSSGSGSTDSSTESSSGDEQQMGRMGGAGGAPGGRSIANNPHDMEFDAGDDQDDNRVATPNQNQGGGGAPAPAPAGHQVLQNNPNDESYAVDDDRGVSTPDGGNASSIPMEKKPSNLGGGKGGLLQNDSHDEFEDVEDDMSEDSPTKDSPGGGHNSPPSNNGAGGAGGFNASHGFNPNSSGVVQNQPHDEQFDVSGSQSQATASPTSTAQSSPQSIKKLPPQGSTQMRPDSDSEEDSSSSEDDEEDDAPRMGQGGNAEVKTSAGLEYNPDDYAHLNNKVSREVRDLFMHIAGYQAVVQELPSKLIPFIPDYLPSVGDIDTFCKVPRPDEQADNFGLVVMDEPAANQSNPIVVKMYIQYTSKQQSKAVYVDSVDDAQNRPQLVDKWITDVKNLHFKKPLPTVNYSKPMPDIESLLQLFPQEFEDLLNSDVQFPPPGVNLDIDQYVRTMCAILDIPCYSNLIESLHVMFTLYLEFRANQHFQHA